MRHERSMAEEVGSSFPFPPPHWRGAGEDDRSAGADAAPPIPAKGELIKCLGDEFLVFDDFPLPSLGALGHKALVANGTAVGESLIGAGARKAGGKRGGGTSAAKVEGEAQGNESAADATAATLAKAVKRLNAEVRASYVSLLDRIQENPGSPAVRALLGDMDNALVNMAHAISRIRPFEARATLATRLKREIAERNAAAAALREAVSGVSV